MNIILIQDFNTNKATITKQIKISLDLFECLEKFRVSGVALHGIRHNGLGQRLGGARLADQEKRNAQLHAHHHHEHILLQGLVPGYVVLQADIVQKHILTSETVSA